MIVTVEFTGMVKALVREKSTELTLPENANFHTVTRAIAEKYPELVGVIITQDKEDLLNANVYSLNGETMIQGELMDENVHQLDKLILLSIIVGGCKVVSVEYPWDNPYNKEIHRTKASCRCIAEGDEHGRDHS